MELGISCYARSQMLQMRQLKMEVGLHYHAGEVVVGSLGSASTLKFLPINRSN